MSMLDEGTCVLCESTFRPEGMTGNKCNKCNGLHPDVNSRQELLEKQDNNKDQRGRLLTEDVVRTLVYEILEGFGMKRKVCEACGTKFPAKSPAAKYCSDRCKEIAKTKNKEDN